MPGARWQKTINDLWGNKTRTALIVLSIAVGLLAVGTILSARTILSSEMAEAYAAIKRQLRGAVIEKIERAITNLDDPQRAGWFTSETADAAKRVLAGEG